MLLVQKLASSITVFTEMTSVKHDIENQLRVSNNVFVGVSFDHISHAFSHTHTAPPPEGKGAPKPNHLLLIKQSPERTFG